ncbi:hypothetical protein SVAN01_09571 [Stagonosporopsis vannaccii]|nr:hypothetical protein SVAN01_09571 [Stagonosporopsis vannaccii]
MTWGPCSNRPSGSDKGKCDRPPAPDWPHATLSFPSVLQRPDPHRALSPLHQPQLRRNHLRHVSSCISGWPFTGLCSCANA